MLVDESFTNLHIFFIFFKFKNEICTPVRAFFVSVHFATLLVLFSVRLEQRLEMRITVQLKPQKAKVP